MLGLKFRRQHVVENFIVDFYCLSERMVIEIEGDAHDSRERQTWRQVQGVRTQRRDVNTGRAGGQGVRTIPSSPK
jgi:very-short-patch-repair endonuclease